MSRIVSKGEIRQHVLGEDPDDVWRATLGWSRTLAPFWLDALPRFAAIATVPEPRLLRLTAAAEHAFDRMDDWWHGRVAIVKARRNEIDGAISLLRNTALSTQVKHLIQAPVARHAAGALRVCLSLSTGGYSRDQLSRVVPGLVYDWACCRALFPGDPATLLQHVPDGLIRRGSSADPDFFDADHLVFDQPASAFGLRTEADAVYAQAAQIWARFADPVQWPLPAGFWDMPSSGIHSSMHFAQQRAFHRPTST